MRGRWAAAQLRTTSPTTLDGTTPRASTPSRSSTTATPHLSRPGSTARTRIGRADVQDRSIGGSAREHGRLYREDVEVQDQRTRRAGVSLGPGDNPSVPLDSFDLLHERKQV